MSNPAPEPMQDTQMLRLLDPNYSLVEPDVVSWRRELAIAVSMPDRYAVALQWVDNAELHRAFSLVAASRISLAVDPGMFVDPGMEGELAGYLSALLSHCLMEANRRGLNLALNSWARH